MATVVIIDQIDGANASVANTGQQIERVATVSGLTSSADQLLLDAVFDAGVPNIGDAHPGAAGTLLKRIIPTALSSDKVRLRLIYDSGVFVPTAVSVVGSLSQTQTNVDRFGNAIQVSYNYPNNWEAFGEFAGKAIPKGANVPFLKPGVNVTVTKTKTTTPWNEILEYTGTVNSGNFRIGNTFLTGKLRWLCTGITSAAISGSFVAVTYNFQYNANTWNAFVVYNDPNLGAPPPDVLDTVAQPNAQGSFQIYDIKNFNALFL